MKKAIYRIFTVCTSIAITIIIAFVAIMIPANSKAFYRWQFEKHNTLDWVQSQSEILLDDTSPYYDEKAGNYVANMTEQQLENLMLHVMRYCLWLEDDMNITVDGQYLKIFREDEKSHMFDVKRIFGALIILTILSLLTCIAFLFFIINRPKIYYETSRKIPFITLGVVLALFAFIAIWTIIDYKFVFEVAFHNLFFTGNFAFSDGVMISMIGEIFSDLILLIGIGFLVFTATVFVAFALYNRRVSKKLANEPQNSNNDLKTEQI